MRWLYEHSVRARQSIKLNSGEQKQNNVKNNVPTLHDGVEMRKVLAWIRKRRARMLFDAALGGLQNRVVILETVIDILSNILPAPKLHVSAEGRGFRYENPDVRHFCLLKAVRVVSALNAAIELARRGYVQELATLMRVVEGSRKHIEYVTEVDDGEQHRANVAKYLREFFDDTVRDPEAEIKGVLIRERIINEQLGRTLDRLAAESGEDMTSRVPAAKLYHRSSRAFSFYVHARYPETMDLYGGRPGRWHLRGMHGTPKDSENLETLDSFVTGASTAFVTMIQGLPQLREVILRQPRTRQWYAEEVGR